MSSDSKNCVSFQVVKFERTILKNIDVIKLGSNLFLMWAICIRCEQFAFDASNSVVTMWHLWDTVKLKIEGKKNRKAQWLPNSKTQQNLSPNSVTSIWEMTHTGKPPVPLAELEILHPPQSEETTLDLESQWASIANQKHFKSTILNAFCEHRQASYEQCRNFFCVQKFF